MQEGAKTQMLQTLSGQLHILLHEGRWRSLVVTDSLNLLVI